MGRIDTNSLKNRIDGLISPFGSDWANKKENMSNIQIPSTDLGLYHQKAQYNWFFMHKKSCPQGDLNPDLPGERPRS